MTSLDAQSFLGERSAELEKLRSEASGMDSNRQADNQQITASLEIGVDGDNNERERKVNEHIGPVQFNMGGIQVDADDMLQRLRVCCSGTCSAFLFANLEIGSANLPDTGTYDFRSCLFA